MKLVKSLILLLFTSTIFGQNQSNHSIDKFSLSISTFNHAELVYNGRTTCLLTDSFIRVSKRYLLDTTTHIVYTKRFHKKDSVISAINRISLDTLEDFYFNYCIMDISGSEFYLDFTRNSTEKHISMHHYYLKQIDEIVQLINSILPNKYQLKYLRKETKQDCKPWYGN